MKTTKPPAQPVGRESDKFMLRFPEGMRDQVATSAASSGRSMNAEIIARLKGSYEPALTSIPWPDLIETLQKEAAQRGATITITLGK